MKNCTTPDCEACNLNNSQDYDLFLLPCGATTLSSKPEDRLVFLLSGSIEVTNNNHETILCKEEEILLLLKDCAYDVTVLEEARLLTVSFTSTCQVCEQMGFEKTRVIMESIHYKFHAIPFREPVNLLIESILNYFNDNFICHYWQRAKLFELFVIFWNYYSPEEVCHFFYPIINKDIGFKSKVIANSTKAKNVVELAKLCGYSLSTFYKLFSEHFQFESPYKWMLQQSAPFIKIKLLDHRVPIKTIVADFGFIDQSHLNRYCKRFFRATPLQIRKGID